MGVIEIDDVVCPVFQIYDEPPFAVKVLLLPEQTVVLPLMAAVMGVDTFTFATAEAVHTPLVTVTVYELETVGVTEMEEVVAPVLQIYVPPPVALILAVAPRQMDDGVIVKIILGVTVTSTLAVSEHPPELTVTE